MKKMKSKVKSKPKISRSKSQNPQIKTSETAVCETVLPDIHVKLTPEQNTQKSCSVKKINKWHFLLTAFAIITSVIIISAIYISKSPNYSYRDLKWSPSASSISYIRSITKQNTDKNSEFSTAQEIWVLNLSSRTKKKIAELTAENGTISLLGWDADDSKIFIKKQDKKTIEVYAVTVDGSNIRKYNLSLPGLQKILFDKGVLFTQQYDRSSNSKKIGFLSLKDCKYNEITDFSLRNNESLEMTYMKVSYHLDKCAFGIYYALDENDIGKTHIWIYDFNEKKLKKPQIQSLGREISFKWSPYDDFIGACIAERSDIEHIFYTICFYDIQNEVKVKKLSATDLSKSFEIFWNQQNKLFIVMKNSIYLMLINQKLPVAKPLLKWDATGFNPEEYDISPDGKKIVFNSILFDKMERNDVFLMDIDGTNINKLVLPEGKRILERNPFFNYFLTSKKVIENMFSYRKIHKS